jgi:DNA-binding GntR family transcriptional regulator
MDNLIDKTSPTLGGSGTSNNLWQYLQTMEPETVTQMSKPASEEVIEVMERHIVSLLGALPPDQFGVMITTSREHLGRLVASAMMNGYFLKTVEQRLAVEKSFGFVQASSPDPSESASA